jgi:imidazoleglycerol phosphate synthase glutamine amidotransferase subunit HisH
MSTGVDRGRDGLPAGLSQPAERALAQAGDARLTQFTQFTQVSEADRLGLPGVGPKAVRRLREVLDERGVAFRQD